MENGKYSAEIGGFTIAPDIISLEHGVITACVYGKIWRYEKMRDGVCKASIATMAAELGMSYNTMMSHIDKLEASGYIEDLTPDLRNRPHVYRTTGRLKIEINVIPSTPQILESTHQSTPQKLTSTPQKLHSHTSKTGDESDSLIDELREEKKRQTPTTTSSDFVNWQLGTAAQCERLYTKITAQVAIPPSQADNAMKSLEAILGYYRGDIEAAYPPGRRVFLEWCSTQGKSGKTYSRTNTAWLERWLSNLAPEPLAVGGADSEETAAAMRAQKAMDQLRERMRL